MVSSINNIEKSSFQLPFSKRDLSTIYTLEPLNSFASEDEAIISSEAKLLNELDKFNSGADNDVDLALANVMAEFTVDAEVNVVQAKKDMIESILEIGK